MSTEAPAPTFYIETSAWGSLAPRQPADRKRIVRDMFKLLDGVRGICVVSVHVVKEIKDAPPAVAVVLEKEIARVEPLSVSITPESLALAQAYLEAGVVPKRRHADALHVAIATCSECDFLVSWNHRHMTRPSKRLEFEAVNTLHGFVKTPIICNRWRRVMNWDLDDLLDEVDRWKFRLHDRLEAMTAKQRAQFWKEAEQDARALGLRVVTPKQVPRFKGKLFGVGGKEPDYAPDPLLDMVDEWKQGVHEKLKEMTPKQRTEFWKQAADEARAMGLHMKPMRRKKKRTAG